MKAKIIMLIDDEELVLKSVSKLLQKQGFDVIVCKSGGEAIEKIKSEEVNLIVCDVRMPGMTGVETLKKIREQVKSAGKNKIPEIIITGYVEDETNKEVEDLNVAEYLYKPFDMRDFLDAVQRSLEA